MLWYLYLKQNFCKKFSCTFHLKQFQHNMYWNIVDVLKRSIDLPENGGLQHLTTIIDDLRVLVWNFSSFTKCSDASVQSPLLLCERS